jgi:hypothetical protein
MTDLAPFPKNEGQASSGSRLAARELTARRGTRSPTRPQCHGRKNGLGGDLTICN